jgi:serine phosphatase RsbU (regulator of sigma subunit)
MVIQERKPLVVDNLATDRRIDVPKDDRPRTGSMVVVPLISHADLIGILYATKETEYGFFKDDIEVISAFADQATMAIENSRLIDKSLERERLVREMSLAQEMQKRLLPQTLPQLPGIQIDAISTPAFEVGGDYYDVVELNKEQLGIVVGDVSGKGMSAAFYMSEVKGIFQALSRICPSPREFLLQANDVLSGSIDRRSFISLIYGIIEVRTGKLILSRAGHCPMLLVRETEVTYIRPSGMGLGLSDGSTFAGAVEEFSLQLQPGDVCVFYTDGLTEARNGSDEFGYERLMASLEGMRNSDSITIRNTILDRVRNFTEGEPLHDDLTLVVVKWSGPSA